MEATPSGVIPRSQISIGLDPGLRPALGPMAANRVLVIDYFASRGCSAVIGDLTCKFSSTAPGPDYAELAVVEGVPLFVERRLLSVLADAGPSLVLAGPPFARHLAIELEQPERWIDFLDGPGILTGKRGFYRA